MKIYTLGGDKGQTSLGSGTRVSKTHPLVCANGDIDELNAVLGVAAAMIEDAALVRSLHSIQGDLLALGASISAPGMDESKPQVTRARVEWMEAFIDEMDGQLPPLTRFILPGGNQAGAMLQLARCVARRAERSVVELEMAAEGRNAESLRYLNRLSDLLFVMARQVNKGEETEWRPEEDAKKG